MEEAPASSDSSGRTLDAKLQHATFLTDDSEHYDLGSNGMSTLPLNEEAPPGMTPYWHIIKFRDAVLAHVYSTASSEAKSVAMVAACNAVGSAIKVADSRIHVTCSPQVKRIAVDLVSHEMRLAIGTIASRPIVAQYAPEYVGRVVARSLAASKDRQKAIARRLVADSVQNAQDRIREWTEGIVADIVRNAHDRFKVASEVAAVEMPALTLRTSLLISGQRLEEVIGDEPSVCQSPIAASVSRESDQAIDENLSDTDNYPDDDDFESYTSDTIAEDKFEDVSFAPSTQEEDSDLVRETLGRAYKKGLQCSKSRADRRLQLESRGPEQESVEPEDMLQQDIHTPTAEEASHERMIRPDSLRMLASLYGPVADQKLQSWAQRLSEVRNWRRELSTAGSMLSARSTSVGQPTAGRSGFTSPVPTPPSTAKPQKRPAHRLAMRAQSRPNTHTAEEQAGTHLINASHDPEKLRQLDQQRLRRKFLRNRQLCKNQQSQTKHSEAVLQEYQWRLREMEVEGQCRSVENKWHQRELKRREGVEIKRQDLAEKGDDVLNLRYGRFYASPYSQQVAARPSNAESEQTSQVGESELDMMWEAEALGVFQAAYNEAVGRFIDRPEESSSRSQQGDNGEVDGASTSQDSLRQERPRIDATYMLKSLPKGRVEWSSPRNPWCPRRNAKQPPVEAVIASLLRGEYSTASSSAGRSSPTPSDFSQKQERASSSPWKKSLPPLVPRRAVHDR